MRAYVRRKRRERERGEVFGGSEAMLGSLTPILAGVCFYDATLLVQGGTLRRVASTSVHPPFSADYSFGCDDAPCLPTDCLVSFMLFSSWCGLFSRSLDRRVTPSRSPASYVLPSSSLGLALFTRNRKSHTAVHSTGHLVTPSFLPSALFSHVGGHSHLLSQHLTLTRLLRVVVVYTPTFFNSRFPQGCVSRPFT